MLVELLVNCDLDINTLFDFDSMTDPRGPRASGSGGHEENLPRAPTLADAIASLMNSGAEQAQLLQMIVQNTGNGGNRRDPERGVSYT